MMPGSRLRQARSASTPPSGRQSTPASAKSRPPAPSPPADGPVAASAPLGGSADESGNPLHQQADAAQTDEPARDPQSVRVQPPRHRGHPPGGRVRPDQVSQRAGPPTAGT